MTVVTRRALRVYVALSELRSQSGDVLDALIPFFEPILERMDGRIFEPHLLVAGVKKLYHWRINRDIAEHFIPRLTAQGYLQRKGTERDGIYIVTFKKQPASPNIAAIADVLTEIIDEFEKFPPRLTDLLSYKKTRDELTENLIKFVISLDALGEAQFVAEVNRLANDEQKILDQLEEGGQPLTNNDRYICARFVKHICKDRPDFVPHFTRLASVGLLTEVVEDFVKPTTIATKTNLTLVLDCPVALDYLGCSGYDFRDDVRGIIDALRSIGCSVVVFPVTCQEMHDNLSTMLRLPRNRRHGYTHDAMLNGEVMEDFVQAVAMNPERALAAVDISVRSISLTQFPGQHQYFDDARYEDFFSTINWGNDIAAREHDTAALTLTMRLREGKHHSDLFRNRYVFVTRNATFERKSREYCIQSRLITAFQQGPVIHQRELATIAWLRTGLGASTEIPKAHLLAACDRVLRFRMEVKDAVASKLAEVTPDKLEQFDLLIQDHRSLRRLADATLNDERVVTTENAPQLLEAMRQATIAEEKAALQADIKRAREKLNKRHKDDVDALEKTKDELSVATAALTAADAREQDRVNTVIAKTNSKLFAMDYIITGLLLLAGACATFDYFTHYLTTYMFWKAVLGLAGAVGLYHLLANILQWPVYGVASLLNTVARSLLARSLQNQGLNDRFDPETEAEFRRGRIIRINKGQVSIDKEQMLT